MVPAVGDLLEIQRLASDVIAHWLVLFIEDDMGIRHERIVSDQDGASQGVHLESAKELIVIHCNDFVNFVFSVGGYVGIRKNEADDRRRE